MSEDDLASRSRRIGVQGGQESSGGHTVSDRHLVGTCPLKKLNNKKEKKDTYRQNYLKKLS